MSDMTRLNCGKCGINFDVPTHWYKSHADGKTEDDRTFYCPNGHTRIFTERTSDRLQRELDRAKQELAYKDSRIADETKRADRFQRALKKSENAHTNTVKRATAGTCLCCHRTFKQLAAHMKTKHPDFKPVALVATSP
jgi:hypothetical protein